jgi:hypothetical protein
MSSTCTGLGQRVIGGVRWLSLSGEINAMKLINLLILFVVLVASQTALASGKCRKGEKKEKIVGTVIAQYSLLPCVYHPCAVWLIVRAGNSDEKQPRYLRVTVEYFPTTSLPDGGFPTELVAKAREWKFEAVRIKEREQAVEKYLTVVNLETGKDESERMAVPAWKVLPGAESERIPVGEVLPYYDVSADCYKPHGKGKK